MQTNSWPRTSLPLRPLLFECYGAGKRGVFTHPLTVGGDGGTTDNLTTSFLHLSLFSTALWDLRNSGSVHPFCLPRLLPSLTLPCKTVLARPDEQETCPFHFSLRIFTMVRRSLYGPTACWILAQTSLLVPWSLYQMCNILWWHLSTAHILCSSVRVHDLQAYRKMDVTRKHVGHILELREILLLFQTGFNLVNAAVVRAILDSISGS